MCNQFISQQANVSHDMPPCVPHVQVQIPVHVAIQTSIQAVVFWFEPVFNLKKTYTPA